MSEAEQIDAEVPSEVVEAPTEAIESEESNTPEEKAADPSESSPDKEDGVQKRINKATRKQRDAERDRDYWREQAMKAEKPEPEPVKAEPLEVKTLEDFEYDEAKYQAYIFDTAQKQAVEAAKSALKEDKTKTDAELKQKAFSSRELKYSEEIPDYMEVTRDDSLNLTKDMVDIAAESDDGPALLYYLAKNPDVSDTIARLSPLAAAREMGRIEATKLNVEPKKTTDAPKPPPKIDGVNAGTQKKQDDMTVEEWRVFRRKQRERRNK